MADGSGDSRVHDLTPEEVARGLAELLDRVVAVESQLRAVASALDVAELVGGPPPPTRGLSYACARVAAVDHGQFGEQAVAAFAQRLATERGPGGLVLVNLSGRGDKDVRTVAALDGENAP